MTATQIALGALLLGTVVLAGFVYLGVVLAWESQRTEGTGYYGASPEERAAFRRVLGVHARLLHPILRLTARFTNVTLRSASFEQDGLAGPKGTCSPESFERGRAYEPAEHDVFVVTQMKCGTTWMQHVVYQVLTRGRGDLAERGDALYAVSPWLEGVRSVAVDDAPAVGEERPSRIIKTHFPAEACPFDARARYIYVARHPVSCFASCRDFLRENLGVFAPEMAEVVDWFRGDESMWWGTWPRHVEGWWRRSLEHDNVLFVHFEEMRSDLAGVVRQVTSFLDVRPLDDDELAAVVERCGFEYMRSHASSFEMHPPHLLAANADLFVKGTSDRYRDVPETVRAELMRWCSETLADARYPFRQRYGSEADGSVAGVALAGGGGLAGDQSHGGPRGRGDTSPEHEENAPDRGEGRENGGEDFGT